MVDSRYHTYAHDIQIYTSKQRGMIDDVLYRLNEDLKRIFNGLQKIDFN